MNKKWIIALTDGGDNVSVINFEDILYALK